MICLLGEPEDPDLVWLGASLRARGEEVEVVVPEALTIDSFLSYRIDAAGVSWNLQLNDGRIFEVGKLQIVVNRMHCIPRSASRIAAADAAFLAEEWRATLSAWLRTLSCPVLNPPRAASLAGPVMTTASWRAIAHAHGLICQPWYSDPLPTGAHTITVTCVGGRCIDASETTSMAHRKSLLALASFVGAPLLGATFDLALGEPRFVDANPFPSLRDAGDSLTDALLECGGADRLSG